MKTTLIVIILTILATVSLVAQTGNKLPLVDHQKHMQMMQMTKDSSMMDMMMSQVAGDRQLRMRMMKKMAEYTEGDKEVMQELCTVMMKSKDATSEGQKECCGMMTHDGMKEGSNKEKMDKEDHPKPHKH